MDGTLTLTKNTLAYADVPATSNPTKKYVDWSQRRSYPVKNPKAVPYTVDPGDTLTLFSGTRTLGSNGSTEMVLTLSPLSSVGYRLTWDGVGAAPAFRTDRALTSVILGGSVAVTVNANQTATMVATAWTGVVVGDTVFIPGVTTGDASGPFSSANEGWWTVLSVSGGTIQVARPTGTSFQAVAETATLAADTDIQAFSAAGVQVGDGLNINAGFASTVWGTYQVTAVTAGWVEFTTNKSLPASATAVPGPAGVAAYSSLKRYIAVEADQSAVLRLNGDTGNTNQIDPWTAGDVDNTGFYEKCGAVWSAVVVNVTDQPLNLLFISAE